VEYRSNEQLLPVPVLLGTSMGVVPLALTAAEKVGEQLRQMLAGNDPEFE
jgi:hypothetical protein